VSRRALRIATNVLCVALLLALSIWLGYLTADALP
jgi:hypothetical protein